MTAATEPRRLRPRAALIWLGIVLGHLALFLLVHQEFLAGKLFLGWDAVEESWGDMAYTARALWDGVLPLWNPHERGGYAFLADPQTSVLYPLHWPIHALVPALGLGPWLALARSLVHMAVAGVGMHLLLRHLGCHPAARWIGSLAFILCGRVAKSKDSAGLWSPVWMPVVLWGVLRLLQKPTASRGAVLGVLVALMFYSGYPPNVFRAVVLIGIIGAVVIIDELRRSDTRARLAAQMGLALGIGGVVAILLCLPGILATVGGLEDTVRTSMSRGEVLRSSLSWKAIQEFLIPRVGVERAYGMLYLGVLPGVLAILALLRPDRLRVALFGVAVMFFALACGNQSKLLPFLVDHVPGFDMWRISEQYLFGTVFALATLAGLGAHDLFTAPSRRRLWIGLGILAAWLVFAAVCWSNDMPKPHRLGKTLVSRAAVFFALGAMGVLVLCTLRPPLRRIGLVLSLPLMLVDLRIQLEPTYRIGRKIPNTKRDARLVKLAGLDAGMRFMDDNHFRWRAAARTGLDELSGRYNTMVTARWKAFSDAAWRDARLMGHASVRWAAGGRARKLARRRRPKGSKAPRLIHRRGGVYEVSSPAPFAFHRDSALRARSARDALRRLRGSTPGQVAVVEFESPPAGLEAALGRRDGRTRPVSRARAEWGEIDLQLPEPAAGVVVVNTAFAPDWTATDGAGNALPVVRANHLFMGVVVGPETRAVMLRYRPTRVYAGLWVSALTVLGLLGWAGWRRRRGRG